MSAAASRVKKALAWIVAVAFLMESLDHDHPEHGRSNHRRGPARRAAQHEGGAPACFGFLASLQYTSMNTLVYADIDAKEASMASTIASTLQQMSMSFGVAAASLTTAVFIPDRFRSDSGEMIHGVHGALVALGALTVLSAFVFRELRSGDGDNVSLHTIHEP